MRFGVIVCFDEVKFDVIVTNRFFEYAMKYDDVFE